LEGRAREWFANGRLYREFRYRHGQEDGAQRMWYADGTLRASCVVRDGRRWGLMGAKGCTGHPSAARPSTTEVGG
jgi:antitoxin component YwqK of YwqJK toxin-antitoxin module